MCLLGGPVGFAPRIRAKHPVRTVFGCEPTRLVLFCNWHVGAAGRSGRACSEVAGPAGQITIDSQRRYGFTAIIVAFLGRLPSACGILLAGGMMA